METPELIIQDQSDVDDQIAKRIEAIQRTFGGLGEFFNHLHEQRQDQTDTDSVIDKLIERHLRGRR